MKRHALPLAVVLAAAGGGAALAQPVSEFLVEGNSKTTSATVIQISGISLGRFMAFNLAGTSLWAAALAIAGWASMRPTALLTGA